MTQKYVVDPPPAVSIESTHDRTERPLRDILVELWENTEKLFRQEVKLASAELDLKMTRAKAELVAFATGGALLVVGMLAIVAAVILLLAEVMVPWLAALIVGVVLAGIGFALVKRGPKLSAEELAPTRTIQSVRKDVQAFTEATK